MIFYSLTQGLWKSVDRIEFHCNYGPILYHFWNSDILVKYRDFFIPHLHSISQLGGFPSEYCHNVWYWKTRLVGLLDEEKFWEYFQISQQKKPFIMNIVETHQLLRSSLTLALHTGNHLLTSSTDTDATQMCKQWLRACLSLWTISCHHFETSVFCCTLYRSVMLTNFYTGL